MCGETEGKMLGTKHCEGILLLPLPVLLLLHNEMECFYESQYEKVEALGAQHWKLMAPRPNVGLQLLSHTLLSLLFLI